MKSDVADAETVLEALTVALGRAGRYNRGAMVAPAAILWPDEARQWQPVVPVLRQLHLTLLTLGDYLSEQRTGPAIWMRCLLAGELEASEWPENAVPILYLPGVSRQMLRAVETCPRELRPLAELQYRGVFWSQKNGRDWTLIAFLRAKNALGLDVAQDQPTLEALQRALPELADAPVASLRGRRLEAADFNQLLSQDPPRDLLRWLDSPAETRGRWTSEHWAAFRSIGTESYDFDPETDGELIGVEHLAEQRGQWQGVWARFVDAPRNYPGIPKLLEKAQPRSLALDVACWPKANAEEEAQLRSALGGLVELAPRDAATRIAKLEKHHGVRRGWVWAQLGQAPLAAALEHLAELARGTASALSGDSPAAMADAYEKAGWKIDAAVLSALAAVARAEDLAAVKSALQAVYRPCTETRTRSVVI